MSCLSKHSQTLRARGYRMTTQRLAILEALHVGGHLSPGQVYERARVAGITETTVYRTLEFLAGNGIVNSAQNGSGHLTYELSERDHHHLVCRHCGAQVDLELDSFQETISELEQRTGYQIQTGHLTLWGLCPECAPKP